MRIISQVPTKWLLFHTSVVWIFACFGNHMFSEACECGVSTANRIYYGDNVEAGVYPWMAHLFTENGEAFCGASLISSKYLITAAHCFEDPTASSFVTFGITGFYPALSNSPRHAVEKVIRKSPFHSDQDIAIVKLKRAVSHQPICLPSSTNDYANVKARIIGFGDTENGDSETLQGGDVTVPSNAECNEVNSKHVSSGEMCAGNVDGDPAPCEGDSGGPLMYYNEDTERWELIGVVAASYGCNRTDRYALFTRVSKYIDWIQSNTNDAGCQK